MLLETLAITTLAVWLSCATATRRRHVFEHKIEKMQRLADKMNYTLAMDKADALERLLQNPEALGEIDTQAIEDEIERLRRTGEI